MREIIRICDKAGIVCGTGTAAMMTDFFDKWGERDTAFLTYGVGRAAFAGWQAWNLAFGDSVSNQRIAEIERMLRNDFAFKWFAIQRVGGRVVFIMTLRVARKAYNVAPPKNGPTPTPTSDEWLWFQMPDGGTVTLTKVGSPTAVVLEYSLDNGATWTTWTESGTTRTQTLAAGQVMHVRNASPTPSTFSTGTSDRYDFSASDKYHAGGKLSSLLCADASQVSNYPGNSFAYLFTNDSNLLSSPIINVASVDGSALYRTFRFCTSLELVRQFKIGSINGFGGCRGAFYGCTALKEITLETPIVGQSGLREAFGGCSSLKTITASFVDISASLCLSAWVSGVAATGDFYCPQALTIPTGVDGIPAGWTRHDL